MTFGDSDRPEHQVFCTRYSAPGIRYSPTPTQLHVPAGLKQFSPFTFILNAAHDTLPHNANLHLWGKKASDTCPLCHADNQNLVHVLNLCQVALNLRRNNDRHDSVLLSFTRPSHNTSLSPSLALWIWPTDMSPTLCQLTSDPTSSGGVTKISQSAWWN